MRFHAILPVRDEADVIGQSLRHMLGWADGIYVFDTGSVDETWEIVQDIAAKDRRVKPLGKDTVFFAETRLRGWIFHQARRFMRTGDWFVRVDADEFHHVSPRKFVETRMRTHETIAYHQYYDFQLTEAEAKAWEARGETVADREKPIEQRRRWFIPSTYSEPRLCRYRDSMQWPPSVSFPFNAGFVARERLPIRHYPHRDPVQLKRRCRLRAIMMADNENRSNWLHPELHHWAEQEWRKFIVPNTAMNLRYWEFGKDLPQFHFTNHLAPLPKRILQRVAHRFLLPLMDSHRPRWPEEAYPQRIPEPLVQRLKDDLNTE